MNSLQPVPVGVPRAVDSPGPTYEGFVLWIEATMGIPTENMPADETLQAAYCQAQNLTYVGLASIPSYCPTSSIYALAVYNLGGHILVEIAQDAANQKFWSDLRNRLGINSLITGLMTSAHDQGTGESQAIPYYLLNMTLMGLQLMKTPWGRMYLMLAGQWGTLWGLTI